MEFAQDVFDGVVRNLLLRLLSPLLGPASDSLLLLLTLGASFPPTVGEVRPHLPLTMPHNHRRSPPEPILRIVSGLVGSAELEEQAQPRNETIRG